MVSRNTTKARTARTEKASKSYPFKFSVIMCIYNTEQWLEEAVDSIINQDIGFEESVQIIFVNDGSPDNSEEICLRYRDKYPDNIVYTKKENGGLASAKNAGLELVQGEYVSFFDPDDILSEDTLSGVARFFADNTDEIDLVSIKLIFFEARNGPHYLNYKFDEDAVIDLDETFDYPQLSSASAFFRHSAIGGLRFKQDLRISEDVRFVTLFLLNKRKYGVLSEPTYFYRRRLEGNSIIANRDKTDYWFTSVIRDVHKYLFDYSLDRFGHIPKFIQYMVLYDLHGAIMDRNNTSILTSRQYSEYQRTVYSILDNIDDDIIRLSRELPREYKLHLLARKYGEIGLKNLQVDNNGIIRYRDSVVFKLKRTKVTIQLMEVTRGFLCIEGVRRGFAVPGVEFFATCRDIEYKIERISRPTTVKTALGERVYEELGFSVKIPLSNNVNVVRLCVRAGRYTYKIPLAFTRLSGLSDFSKYCYRYTNGNIITADRGKIKIVKSTPKRRLKHELRYNAYLTFLNGRKRIDAVFMRVLTYITRYLYRKKPVWIISDRLVCGRDNGEALFRYISTLDEVPATVFFAVNKSSEDYARLKKYGKVVDRKSMRYKLLFLTAKKVISSHFDDFVINPFARGEDVYRDLFRFDYVFLQHGITKNNMAVALNRYRKNIKLFVTATKMEQDAILTGGYGYTDDQVRLTGFPRFDLLENNPKNKLIIMPTWRKYLAIAPKSGTDEREYDDSFRDTQYFYFYNSLINDKRIIRALDQARMTCEFYLHPNLSRQIEDFDASGRVNIMKMPYDYQKAFSEGDLFVTDYSSVVFDFSYLKKPIIYAQFDLKEFREGHYEQGYFSYEDHGLGPVVTEYEDIVQAIIRYIEKENKMTAKYEKRVNNFFYKLDNKNSERVYKAIIKMDQ